MFTKLGGRGLGLGGEVGGTGSISTSFVVAPKAGLHSANVSKRVVRRQFLFYPQRDLEMPEPATL